MDRRHFLQLAVTAPLALSVRPALARRSALRRDRRMVIIHLAGGCDGLHMFAPFANASYQASRPSLALKRAEVLEAGPGVGFHKALSPMIYAWDSGELAVVQGVGVDARHRDHASATFTMACARPDATLNTPGWLAPMLTQAQPEDQPSPALLLGEGPAGALQGSGAARLTLNGVRPLQRLRPSSAVAEHLLALTRQRDDRLAPIRQTLQTAPGPKTAFPDTPLGHQLAAAARMILADHPTLIYQTTHHGYDTHSNQRAALSAQFKSLAEAVAAFRSEMIRAERWDHVLVMLTSEFGRAVEENTALGGTAHGEAGQVWLLGGDVRGGLHGAPPALDKLTEGGGLPITTPMRDVCATVLKRWWGASAGHLGRGGVLTGLF